MFTGLYTVYVYVPSSFFTIESPTVPTSVPSEENAKTVSPPFLPAMFLCCNLPPQHLTAYEYCRLPLLRTYA